MQEKPIAQIFEECFEAIKNGAPKKEGAIYFYHPKWLEDPVMGPILKDNPNYQPTENIDESPGAPLPPGWVSQS